MRRMLVVAGVLIAGALAAPDGVAAEETCRLDGREYPSNAVVCSGGLSVYCSNGTWQDNGGQRCDAREGAYLTPLRPFREKSDEPIPEFYKEKYPWLHLQ